MSAESPAHRWVTVALVVAVVLGVVLLEALLPDVDVAPFAAVVVALLSLIRVQETHVLINSRMDELLKSEKATSRAAGATEERARADKANKGRRA